MAYMEIKTVNGREYMYRRHSIRLPDGRVVHKNVKYLGPVNPIYQSRRRKSNAWLFVRDLSDTEHKALEKAKKSPSGFTRDRARIILFSAEKKPCDEIAAKLGCDPRKARCAVKDFNARGLECLIRGKAKGAEPKFTDDIKKRILQEFAQDPLECGHAFTAWTLPRFRKHLIDSKVVESISIETVRQILDQAGARLKRSKRWQYSGDPELLKKNKR